MRADAPIWADELAGIIVVLCCVLWRGAARVASAMDRSVDPLMFPLTDRMCEILAGRDSDAKPAAGRARDREGFATAS